MQKDFFQYSRREEYVNFATHLVGLLLSLALAIYFAGNSYKLDNILVGGSSIFFALALSILFLSSSAYHICFNFRLKKLLRKVDHCAIYFFIGATYTHFIIHHFDRSFTQLLLFLVWSLALGGIVFKLVSQRGGIFFSVLTYVGYGAIFFILGFFVKVHMNEDVYFWLVTGGLFYVTGTLAYMLKSVPYHHAVWHVFVLLGACSHSLSVIESVNSLL